MIDLDERDEIAGPREQATPVLAQPQSLFRSFFMGGFESSTHVNTHGERLDMIAAVEHDVRADEDYGLLRSIGIRTARDAVRWHLIERAGTYDFSSFEPMLNAALRQGVQVIWDIFHYGYPDDLDLLSPAFVDRLARFAGAVARFLADHTDEIPFYTPVNEISFFSWAASREHIYPFADARDTDIKHQLIRAGIAVTEAIWDVDPRARIAYPDPLINVVTPRAHPEMARNAKLYRESQFEGWDMIAGYACPELGGAPRYLDIVGVNYYSRNQWEHEGVNFLEWEGERRDPRWMPLDQLLAEVYARYERPIFVAETGHIGVGRGDWLRSITEEACRARQAGVPLEGICLYPILDRHDWVDRKHWHNSGMWDFASYDGPPFERVLNETYAEELRSAQKRFAALGCR